MFRLCDGIQLAQPKHHMRVFFGNIICLFYSHTDTNTDAIGCKSMHFFLSTKQSNNNSFYHWFFLVKEFINDFSTKKYRTL